MTSTQIECFMTAAECLNFTLAAEKLFISQPALSRSIAALETALDMTLFLRENNVVTLSPGGEIVYNWLSKEKTAFLSMLNDARRKNENREELNIGYVKNEMMKPEYARAVVEFKQSFPSVELEMLQYERAMNLVEALRSHEIDIAIVMGPVLSCAQDLEFIELDHYQRYIAVSSLHRFAKLESISFAQLAGETFVSIDSAKSPTMSPGIRRICLKYGFEPKIVETAGIDELISMVSVNKGIALLYEEHAGRLNPMLHFLKLEEELPIYTVCAWDGKNKNPNIEKLIACMKNAH